MSHIFPSPVFSRDPCHYMEKRCLKHVSQGKLKIKKDPNLEGEHKLKNSENIFFFAQLICSIIVRELTLIVDCLDQFSSPLSKVLTI